MILIEDSNGVQYNAACVIFKGAKILHAGNNVWRVSGMGALTTMEFATVTKFLNITVTNEENIYKNLTEERTVTKYNNIFVTDEFTHTRDKIRLVTEHLGQNGVLQDNTWYDWYLWPVAFPAVDDNYVKIWQSGGAPFAKNTAIYSNGWTNTGTSIIWSDVTTDAATISQGGAAGDVSIGKVAVNFSRTAGDRVFVGNNQGGNLLSIRVHGRSIVGLGPGNVQILVREATEASYDIDLAEWLQGNLVAVSEVLAVPAAGYPQLLTFNFP